MEKKASKSSVKKFSNKCKKGLEELDDVGSLIFLKNVTESKKLNGIDEKIKLLKTELKSLLGDKKSGKDCNFFADYKNDIVCSDLINIDEINKVTPKILNSDTKKSSEFYSESLISSTDVLKPSTSSIPTKFSEWLDKTIDEMDSKPEIKENNQPQTNIAPLHSKIPVNFTEVSPCLVSNFTSKFFNMSFLPQNQVEKLLYKTFVMQNSEIYLSSSDDSSQECIKSTRQTKQQKCRRSRKSKKSLKRKLIQTNLNKKCRFSQQERKRKLINRNSFLNEVEVIDLDNSLGNNSFVIKEMPKTDNEALDVENYNWNEPFEIDEDTGSLSDMRAIDFTENSVKLDNQDLEFSDIEMLNSDKSVCYSEGSKVQQKRVWECPVCFEKSKGQEVVATQCGHIFCRNCIENYSSKLGNSCPACRSDLRDKPLITLFNF